MQVPCAMDEQSKRLMLSGTRGFRQKVGCRFVLHSASNVISMLLTKALSAAPQVGAVVQHPHRAISMLITIGPVIARL